MCDSKPILVIGDLMLDRRTVGRAERIAPEAPAIVFATERDGDDQVRLGGGAVAPQILAGWGSPVIVAGVVGNDAFEATFVVHLSKAIHYGSLDRNYWSS